MSTSNLVHQRLGKSAFMARCIQLFALCILLASCAVSPQTIVVKPDLKKITSMPIGHGLPVKVETRDLRSDKILGTRGGVYESAFLTTDERMEKTINEEAIAVLQRWDFAAVPTTLGNQDMMSFTIEVIDIDYQRPKTNVGGFVEVKCRVAVKIQTSDKNYSGEYLSKRSEQVAVMGTAEGNRRLVNETINQALGQIFRDSKLQGFMSR